MQKNRITPLLLFFVFQLLSGIYILLRPDNNDPEGWHYLVGFIFCLFAFIPLVLDFLLKRFVKKPDQHILIQFLITFILLLLYFKWDLIILSA